MQCAFIWPILIWKCALRHSGFHFWDIGVSENWSENTVFFIFQFSICFAPRQRVFFSIQLIHATAACEFCTSQLPNCVRNQVILLILILKCVMCHSRVQFLSSRNGSANNICFVYFGFVLRCENKSWLAVQKVLRGRRALRGASGLNKQ